MRSVKKNRQMVGCPADVVAYCAGRPFSGYRHEFPSKEEEWEEYLLVRIASQRRNQLRMRSQHGSGFRSGNCSTASVAYADRRLVCGGNDFLRFRETEKRMDGPWTISFCRLALCSGSSQAFEKR
jgi:hypothetical protein